jgi:hypothetical protein
MSIATAWMILAKSLLVLKACKSFFSCPFSTLYCS